MQELALSTPTKKKRRQPLTKEQWAQHVAAWKGSGLSKPDYCEQHDIHSAILDKWARIMGVSRNKKFKAVRVAMPVTGRQALSGAGVEIMVGQSIRIRITGVSEASLVVDIIKGLHACS
jgi:hypothetical protein